MKLLWIEHAEIRNPYLYNKKRSLHQLKSLVSKKENCRLVINKDYIHEYGFHIILYAT